jgi:hypothetical protein
MSDGFKWITHTEPFESLDGSPALFVLEQVDDAAFRLRRGFRYRHRDGSTLEVSDATLGLTDLASIPTLLAWFVSRQGRHTPAALVHDQLVTGGMPLSDRVVADRTFLEAMDALGVPPVRSHIMWTGVTLATRWRGGLRTKTGIVLWLAGSAAGTALLIHGLVTGSPGEVAIALLLPLPAGALWGKQIWAGVVAGYSIWFVVIPALASFFGYSSYRVAEEVVRYGRKAFSRRGQRVPTPVPYREA